MLMSVWMTGPVWLTIASFAIVDIFYGDGDRHPRLI